MKLALVTGGTQRIGAAIAARLAREGHALALHYRSAETLDPELQQALTETGCDHASFQADLARPDGADRLLAAVEAHFGAPVRTLVNSASLFGSDDLASTDMHALLDHYAVGCAAPALLARGVAASASAERPGVIINMLDQRLRQPHGDNLAYSLAKYALEGLTQILARALAPHVRVCAVAPGLTLETAAYSEAQIERVRAMMPLERLPTPSQLADAVAYLVQAKAVTAQVLYVDGGAHLRQFERDFHAL